jgi:hypothetical protein
LSCCELDFHRARKTGDVREGVGSDVGDDDAFKQGSSSGLSGWLGIYRRIINFGNGGGFVYIKSGGTRGEICQDAAIITVVIPEQDTWDREVIWVWKIKNFLRGCFYHGKDGWAKNCSNSLEIGGVSLNVETSVTFSLAMVKDGDYPNDDLNYILNIKHDFRRNACKRDDRRIGQKFVLSTIGALLNNFSSE